MAAKFSGRQGEEERRSCHPPPAAGMPSGQGQGPLEPCRGAERGQEPAERADSTGSGGQPCRVPGDAAPAPRQTPVPQVPLRWVPASCPPLPNATSSWSIPKDGSGPSWPPRARAPSSRGGEGRTGWAMPPPRSHLAAGGGSCCWALPLGADLGAKEPRPPSSPEHAAPETPDPGKGNGSTRHWGTTPHLAEPKPPPTEPIPAPRSPSLPHGARPQPHGTAARPPTPCIASGEAGRPSRAQAGRTSRVTQDLPTLPARRRLPAARG